MLKLFRSTGLMFILTAFSLSVSLAEDEITISTYYPSPHGVYNKLQTDKLGIGDNDGDGNLTSADTPDETGNVWIAGKVGIGTGTTDPGAELEVAGIVKITGGSPGAGKVLTSDANGLASWGAISAGVPTGFCIFSDIEASCPIGWTRRTQFDGRTIVGAAVPGGTGGNSTHGHSRTSSSCGPFSGISGCTGSSVDGGVAPASNWPPYTNVLICCKN